MTSKTPLTDAEQFEAKWEGLQVVTVSFAQRLEAAMREAVAILEHSNSQLAQSAKDRLTAALAPKP